MIKKIDDNKKLTVVITTYNRKEPLLQQLKSLELQGQYDKYEIIISDNHSDYDIKEWISRSLCQDFLNIVTVYVHPFNVGGDLNITLSFQLPKTKWMWLLSDDDITDPNSINTVLSDIEKHDDDDVCWLRYSISGFYKSERNVKANSLVDFFNIYQKGHTPGEMVFMANNVYRLRDLRCYLTEICKFDDTCMSQILLPLFAIKNEKKTMVLSPECLTNYVEGRASYSMLFAYMRFSNLLYVTTLPLSKREINEFKKLNFISSRRIVSYLVYVDNRKLRWEYFKKIFIAHYKLLSLKGVQALLNYCIMELISPKRILRRRQRKAFA